MKKTNKLIKYCSVLIFGFFVLLISAHVYAQGRGVGSPTTECQNFGFQSGIVKWEYEDGSWRTDDDNDHHGTAVVGGQ